MLIVNTHITIGDYEFPYCVDVEIVSSVDTLTDTCKITLPRKFEWDCREIALGDDPILKRGMPVVVKAGYDGTLITEFIGFVKNIKSGVPVQIECEDSMFLLKQGGTEVTKSYKNPTLSKILSDILPKGIKFKVPELLLGGLLRLNKLTPAKALEEMKTKHGIYSYFRIVNSQPVLYSGLAYWTDNRHEEDFKFGYNIIEHSNLVYRREEDVKLLIKAFGISKDNKRVKVEVGDPDGEIRTFHYYETNKEVLKRRAEQDLARLKYTGYYGDFLTFGAPSIQKGDIANLIGNQYNPDGKYLIKKVTKRIGVTTGYRQSIEPESIINDKRTNTATG